MLAILERIWHWLTASACPQEPPTSPQVVVPPSPVTVSTVASPRSSSGLLMKDEIPEAKPTPPAKRGLAAQMRFQSEQAIKQVEYERECPYEPADRPKRPVERLSRGGPAVSGGLPSLGKRR